VFVTAFSEFAVDAFEEGAVAYDHRDAEGFIKLNALRLRTLGQRRRKLKLD
jgi:argininosuccinate synthase